MVDMINSMNTGHAGSLSTGHANSAKGMISRLETMFLTSVSFPMEAIRGQIASAIDIIVHLGRLQDKSRKVLEITEIKGLEDGQIVLNPLFEYRIMTGGLNSDGKLVRTENKMVNDLKLEMRGGHLS